MRGTRARVVVKSQVIVNDEPVALTLRAVVPATKKEEDRSTRGGGKGSGDHTRDLATEEIY